MTLDIPLLIYAAICLVFLVHIKLTVLRWCRKRWTHNAEGSGFINGTGRRFPTQNDPDTNQVRLLVASTLLAASTPLWGFNDAITSMAIWAALLPWQATLLLAIPLIPRMITLAIGNHYNKERPEAIYYHDNWENLEKYYANLLLPQTYTLDHRKPWAKLLGLYNCNTCKDSGHTYPLRTSTYENFTNIIKYTRQDCQRCQGKYATGAGGQTHTQQRKLYKLNNYPNCNNCGETLYDAFSSYGHRSINSLKYLCTPPPENQQLPNSHQKLYDEMQRWANLTGTTFTAETTQGKLLAHYFWTTRYALGTQPLSQTYDYSNPDRAHINQNYIAWNKPIRILEVMGDIEPAMVHVDKVRNPYEQKILNDWKQDPAYAAKQCRLTIKV